jgi:hypothetical protein
MAKQPTGHELNAQSMATLWANYCDKKAEIEALVDALDEALGLMDTREDHQFDDWHEGRERIVKLLIKHGKQYEVARG